jgi:phosphotransferase system IIB component
MSDDELAAEILLLAGGPANVREVDLCITRLRLVLADPAAVDEAAIEALPGVIVAFTQAGQYQIALGARVRRVHGAFRALLAGGR